MNFRIRKALISDAPAIAQILQELGWHEWVNLLPHDQVVAQIQTSIVMCGADKSHSIYVSVVENDVVGYITVHWIPCLFIQKLRGYISDLFIKEGSRRQGIGTALLKTVISEANNRGSGSVTALTRTGRESYKQGFYRNQGWVERPSVVDFIYELPPAREAS